MEFKNNTANNIKELSNKYDSLLLKYFQNKIEYVNIFDANFKLNRIDFNRKLENKNKKVLNKIYKLKQILNFKETTNNSLLCQVSEFDKIFAKNKIIEKQENNQILHQKLQQYFPTLYKNENFIKYLLNLYNQQNTSAGYFLEQIISYGIKNILWQQQNEYKLKPPKFIENKIYLNQLENKFIDKMGVVLILNFFEDIDNNLMIKLLEFILESSQIKISTLKNNNIQFLKNFKKIHFLSLKNYRKNLYINKLLNLNKSVFLINKDLKIDSENFNYFFEKLQLLVGENNIFYIN